MNYDKYIKEFEEKFPLVGNLPYRVDKKDAQSHLLLSQLKTIELLKEELEGMKRRTVIKIPNWDGENKIIGWNSALSQAITLLDTIIQNIKS